MAGRKAGRLRLVLGTEGHHLGHPVGQAQPVGADQLLKHPLSIALEPAGEVLAGR